MNWSDLKIVGPSWTVSFFSILYNILCCNGGMTVMTLCQDYDEFMTNIMPQFLCIMVKNRSKK